MTAANAIKKLTKAGFEVTEKGIFITAKKDRNVIDLAKNGGSENIATIRVRSVCDHDDSRMDYSAGVFCDNVSQAIKLAN